MAQQLGTLSKVWTRKKWTEERDKKDNGPVPKGAAKFSMGDVIDTFHKSAAKGAQEGIKAVEALLSKIGEYKNATKAKYGKFVGVIEKEFEAKAKDYRDEAKKIAESIAAYASKYSAVASELATAVKEALGKGKMKPEDVFVPGNAKALTTALSNFVNVASNVPFYNDKITLDSFKKIQGPLIKAEANRWLRGDLDQLVKMMSEAPKSI